MTDIPDHDESEGGVIDVQLLIAQHDQIVGEMQKLFADLEAARSVASDPGDTERQRRAAAGALAAVVEYLKAIGVKRHLFEPIIELWGALADAEDGLSNPLTAPAEFQRGASTKRKKYMLDRAHAAALVTLLSLAGKKKDQAYDDAARDSGIPRKELLDFRKNLIAKKPRAPKLALRAYKNCLASAGQSRISFREQARALSEMIKSQRG